MGILIKIEFNLQKSIQCSFFLVNNNININKSDLGKNVTINYTML